jgi:hypothetical protein
MAYLLLKEVKNIIAAEKGEKCGRGNEKDDGTVEGSA